MKKSNYILCFVALFMMGCASTYLKESTNVSQVKKKYDKVLVVARAKGNTARFKFEEQVVRDLINAGIAAESSKDVIKTESFSKEVSEGDVEALRSKLVKDGFSGVIITNLVNTSEYTDVIPGRTSTINYPMRYGRFGRYYGAYPVTYWEPDQVLTGIEYTLESCLYDITVDQRDNLQWVGRFKVKSPSSLVKTIENYSRELTTALLEQSISK